MAADNWIGSMVSYRTNWTDVWTQKPDVIVNSLSRSLCPTVDTAVLTWRVGQVLQAGDATFTTASRFDLVGKFVRIQISAMAGGKTIDWVGYVTSSRADRWGGEDPGGGFELTGETYIFQAVGMEWFLDRAPITSSKVWEDNVINRAIGFNTGKGKGRDIGFVERGNMDNRSVADLSFAKDFSHTQLWTAEYIVDYLLENNISSAPCAFSYISAGEILLWFTPTVQTENRTVWQVLNAVLHRRRGLAWWLTYNSVAETMEVEATTTTPIAINLPDDKTIPVASTRVDWDFDDELRVASASVAYDHTREYSRVKVRGARRTSVFTVSIYDETLEAGWTATNETAYKDAAKESTGYAALSEDKKKLRNDRERKKLELERVYQTFTVPLDWDGKSGSGGSGGAFEYSCPEMPQGSISILGTEAFSITGLRLLRTMPLLAGYDYTDAANPVAGGPANRHPEFVQPFAIVRSGEQHVFMHKSAGHEDENSEDANPVVLKTSYHLRVMANEPGIEIMAGAQLPHCLAKNHFEPTTDEPSGTKPEIDFEDMRVTVCGEWDSYCEAKFPDIADGVDNFQELLISIGNKYRLDYLASNTVFDIEDGEPKLVTSGAPITDHRDFCQQIAEAAWAWYETPRANLEVKMNVLDLSVDLGDLIEDIGRVGFTNETINATVSRIVHAVEDGRTVFIAGYQELDFAGLV